MLLRTSAITLRNGITVAQRVDGLGKQSLEWIDFLTRCCPDNIIEQLVNVIFCPARQPNIGVIKTIPEKIADSALPQLGYFGQQPCLGRNAHPESDIEFVILFYTGTGAYLVMFNQNIIRLQMNPTRQRQILYFLNINRTNLFKTILHHIGHGTLLIIYSAIAGKNYQQYNV